MKLTEKTFRSVDLPAGKSDHIEWDDDIRGFGLRIRSGGSRGWVFQYALGEKQRRMSLGAATAESFKKAKGPDGAIKLGIRDLVSQLQAKVRLGQDPASDKSESRKRAADTFEALATGYLAAKKASTRPGTYDEIERHLIGRRPGGVVHAKPLHGLQVTKISRRDIATLLTTIKANSGPVAANRVRSTLSDFFGWCISEGIDGIESNPVLGTSKSEEKSRERVLCDHELRAIWKHAGDDHHGSIIKLMMLTGQRAEEIASVRRSELTSVTVSATRLTEEITLPGFDVRVIDLPGERTKNKRPHLVPLSKSAAAILDAQPARTEHDGKLRDLIFGHGQGGFSGWSRCKERLDESIEKDLGKPLPHWRPHDLRRTMSTLMNDRLGILPHVVEAILNHISGSKAGVAGTYNKALYFRERVAALNAWAEHLAAIVSKEAAPAAREVAS